MPDDGGRLPGAEHPPEHHPAEITAKYVSLSPLAVLLATSIGGVLAGLVGLLLAVPPSAILAKAVSLIRRVDDPTPAATADAT